MEGSSQMIVGVPKEIKNNEFRVGMTPGGAREFVEHGHLVLVERGAGEGSSFTDAEYAATGAEMVDSAEEVFARAEMLVKVKEPQAAEIARLRPGQILYTYLHLAPDHEQTIGLIGSGAVCIAYETVELANHSLPLLAPMSEVAGRMAAQVGATYLQKPFGGRGVLMGGVPGVLPANVVVLGAGVVGINAAYIACG
jgi:alanine dehydrogenase